MVTQTVASPPTRFPDVPPREDMQNSRQLYLPSLLTALRRWLRHVEESKPINERRSAFVMSEMPVRPRPTADASRIFVPDMTVAFDVDEAIIERDNGYAIEHHGKPPSLALEVASPTTGRNDYTIKREGYARFGISEYWRTDPSGGIWHDAELAGDRLQDGEYVPIPIERVGAREMRGYSDVLQLYVCWEDGDLRFYDEEAGYLLTHDEEADGRIAERTARITAETEREEERERRLAAEAERRAAESRVRHLEEQIRRLEG